MAQSASDLTGTLLAILACREMLTSCRLFGLGLLKLLFEHHLVRTLGALFAAGLELCLEVCDLSLSLAQMAFAKATLAGQ